MDECPRHGAVNCEPAYVRVCVRAGGGIHWCVYVCVCSRASVYDACAIYTYRLCLVF